MASAPKAYRRFSLSGEPSLWRICKLAVACGTAFFVIAVIAWSINGNALAHRLLAPGYHLMNYTSLWISLKTGWTLPFGGFEDLPSYVIAAAFDIAAYSFVASAPLVLWKIVRGSNKSGVTQS